MQTLFPASILVLALTSTPILARDCTPAELGTVVALLDESDESYVEENFAGGTSIVSAVLDCTFNEFDRAYVAQGQIDWHGAVVWWNEYQIKGTLRYSADQPPTFTATWASDAVQRLKFWKNVAGAAVQLAAQVR